MSSSFLKAAGPISGPKSATLRDRATLKGSVDHAAAAKVPLGLHEGDSAAPMTNLRFGERCIAALGGVDRLQWAVRVAAVANRIYILRYARVSQSKRCSVPTFSAAS